MRSDARDARGTRLVDTGEVLLTMKKENYKISRTWKKDGSCGLEYKGRSGLRGHKRSCGIP